MKSEIFDSLRGQLIVSCQAEGESPFNSPEGVLAFAISAIEGGAAGIRSCGIDKTKYLIDNLRVPVIGLTKSSFNDGTVCITGSYDDVDLLVKIGTNIVAVDGTFRRRADNVTGPEFVSRIKHTHKDILIMADISTTAEAIACYDAGADCVSTTLSGYTPNTQNEDKHKPSLELLSKCVQLLPDDYPIFAEGRYNTPESAAKAIETGAWSVVVGSAITRPHLITQWFVDAIAELKNS